MSAAEDTGGIEYVVWEALSTLNQLDRYNKYVDYFHSEWFYTADDLHQALLDDTVWANIKIPARLKLEIKHQLEKLPVVEGTAVAENVQPYSEWIQYYSEEHDCYYWYNEVTFESSWENPWGDYCGDVADNDTGHFEDISSNTSAKEQQNEGQDQTQDLRQNIMQLDRQEQIKDESLDNREHRVSQIVERMGGGELSDSSEHDTKEAAAAAAAAAHHCRHFSAPPSSVFTEVTKYRRGVVEESSDDDSSSSGEYITVSSQRQSAWRGSSVRERVVHRKSSSMDSSHINRNNKQTQNDNEGDLDEHGLGRKLSAFVDVDDVYSRKDSVKLMSAMNQDLNDFEKQHGGRQALKHLEHASDLNPPKPPKPPKPHKKGSSGQVSNNFFPPPPASNGANTRGEPRSVDEHNSTAAWAASAPRSARKPPTCTDVNGDDDYRDDDDDPNSSLIHNLQCQYKSLSVAADLSSNTQPSTTPTSVGYNQMRQDSSHVSSNSNISIHHSRHNNTPGVEYGTIQSATINGYVSPPDGLKGSHPLTHDRKARMKPKPLDPPRSPEAQKLGTKSEFDSTFYQSQGIKEYISPTASAMTSTSIKTPTGSTKSNVTPKESGKAIVVVSEDNLFVNPQRESFLQMALYSAGDEILTEEGSISKKGGGPGPPPSNPPTSKVLQQSDPHSGAVNKQKSKIPGKGLYKNVKHFLRGSSGSSSSGGTAEVSRTMNSYDDDLDLDYIEQYENYSGSHPSPPPSAPPPAAEPSPRTRNKRRSQACKDMVQLGFGERESMRALDTCDDDVMQATALLIEVRNSESGGKASRRSGGSHGGHSSFEGDISHAHIQSSENIVCGISADNEQDADSGLRSLSPPRGRGFENGELTSDTAGITSGTGKQKTKRMGNMFKIFK